MFQFSVYKSQGLFWNEKSQMNRLPHYSKMNFWRTDFELRWNYFTRQRILDYCNCCLFKLWISLTRAVVVPVRCRYMKPDCDYHVQLALHKRTDMPSSENRSEIGTRSISKDEDSEDKVCPWILQYFPIGYLLASEPIASTHKISTLPDAVIYNLGFVTERAVGAWKFIEKSAA